MSIFLDVLPRFDLAAAEAGIQKLTEVFRKAGLDVGKVYGTEATNAVRKLQEEVVQAANVASRAMDAEMDKRTAVDLLIKKQTDSEAARGEASAKISRDIELQEQRVQAAKAKTLQIQQDMMEMEDVEAAKLAEYNRARISEIAAVNSLLDKQAAAEAGAASAATAADADRARRAAAQRDLNAATAESAAASDASIAASARANDAALLTGATATTASKSFGLMGAAGLGAFAIIGGEGVKHAAAWESSAARMTAATNMTAGEIKDLQDRLLQLGPQVGQNAQELQDAAYLVAKAGFNSAGDQVDILRVASELAAVEGVGLKESVSGLTTTLNDFHIPASKAADVAAQFQTAFRDAKAPVDELMGSLHNFEPIMKLIASGGGDPSAFVGQTGAMLAQSVQPGTSPDQASQQIRNTLLHLVQANGPQADMENQLLAPMGLTSQSLSTALSDPKVGPIGVMATMQQAIQKATDPKTGMVHLDPKNISLQAKQSLKEAYDALADDPEAQKLASDIMSGNFTSGERKEYSAATKNNPILAQFDNAFNRAEGLSTALRQGKSLDQTPEQIMKALTGSDQGLLMMSQIAGDPETLQKSLNIADKTTKAKSPNGQDIQDWSNVTDTFSFHVKELKATLNSLWTEIGTNVLPAFKGVLDVLKDVAEWMGRNKEVAIGLVDGLGALGAAWVLLKTYMGIKYVIQEGIMGMTSLADVILSKVAISSDAIISGNNLAASSYAEVVTAAGEAAAAIEAQGPAATATAGEVATAAGAEDVALAGVTTAAETAATAISFIGPAVAAALVASNGDKIQKGIEDNVPGAKWLDSLPNPGDWGAALHRWVFDDPNWKGVHDDAPATPGTKSPQSLNPDTISKIHEIPTSPVDQMNAAIAAIPKVDPNSMMTPNPDGNNAAGDGSGSGSSATATGPNIATNLPFHALDLNVADKPINETYDDWISKQKAVQTAMEQVDMATLDEAKANAHMAELVKKGTATQEEWNNASEAVAKAARAHQAATEDLTVAQTKEKEGANKAPKGSKGQGVTGTSILTGDFEFSPKGIATYFSAMLADLALGNPVGKQLAKERGGDPSNPVYVSPVGNNPLTNAVTTALTGNTGTPGQPTTVGSPGAALPGESARDFAHRVMMPYWQSQGLTVGDHAADKYGEHQNGALDLMVNNLAQGQQVLQKVLSDPNVYGAIFNNQTYGYGHGLTPQDYKGGHTGDPSQDHTNHVHAFYKPGDPNDIKPTGAPLDVTGTTGTPAFSAGSAIPVFVVNMGAGGMGGPPGTGGPPGGSPAGGPGGSGGGSGFNWDGIAGFESGGNWADKKGKYEGGLQFDPQTWAKFKPAGAPDNAADATKEQQIAGAEALMKSGAEAATQWPATYAAHPDLFKPSGGAQPGDAGPLPAIPAGAGGGDGYMGLGGPSLSPAFGNPADPRNPGTDLFAPGGVLGGQDPMANPGFTPALGPIAPGSGASFAGASAGRGVGPLPPGMAHQAAGPAPAAQPPAAPATGRQIGEGSNTGPGFSSSIGSTIGGVAASMGIPGAEKAGQLADRAIGYVGQLGGIAAEGLLETFLPNNSPLADPSKSFVGKLVTGIAGAHPSGGNTAGTAPPLTQTAPALQPGSPASGNGSGPPPGPPAPMVNIEHQENHGPDGGQNAANQTARAFIQHSK